MRPKSVPILHISNQINHLRTSILVRKLQRYLQVNPQALAVVVDIPQQLPVEVDELVEQLKMVRLRAGIPIIGFIKSECTPESYLLLSMADKIFTSPACTFTFKRETVRWNMQGILDRFRIRNVVVNTSTKPNFGPHGSVLSPAENIDKRLFDQALAQREAMVGKLNISFDSLRPVMLGQEVVDCGLVDGLGYYEQVLGKLFPEVEQRSLDYTPEKIGLMLILFFVTSPILLMIFFGKATVKWSLIFYAWMKSKDKTLKQVQEEYEAAELEREQGKN